MKTICVLTATRAEYGLLLPVIVELQKRKDVLVRIAVTGSHLSPEFGMTVHEIEADGLHVDKKIEILLSADTPSAISKTMGLALISFADYFAESRPDALLVLGDRYEVLAVCCAAMNERIPILHMCGGETTEGAVDEAVRHSITKMSYLHFTTTQRYRNRVIQLGEDPDRVFWVGSTGVENAQKVTTLSKDDLEREIGFSLGNEYAVATFHPVTLENNTAKDQISELLNAVEEYPDILFLFTKANADADGRIINATIEEALKRLPNIRLVSSLGMKRYMNAVRYASFVIGNSSSGVGEVPAFGIPTVNIGDRQKGRIMAQSVICCTPDQKSITEAIAKARDPKFRSAIDTSKNPYGKGETSRQIADIIGKFLEGDQTDIKKKFYDL